MTLVLVCVCESKCTSVPTINQESTDVTGCFVISVMGPSCLVTPTATIEGELLGERRGVFSVEGGNHGE